MIIFHISYGLSETFQLIKLESIKYFYVSEYLEQCLIPNNDQRQKDFKEIIKSNFKKRDCFTLSMPSLDENKLKSLENENKFTLKNEFL